MGTLQDTTYEGMIGPVPVWVDVQFAINVTGTAQGKFAITSVIS